MHDMKNMMGGMGRVMGLAWLLLVLVLRQFRCRPGHLGSPL